MNIWSPDPVIQANVAPIFFESTSLHGSKKFQKISTRNGKGVLLYACPREHASESFFVVVVCFCFAF